jgi:hypothetical protein
VEICSEYLSRGSGGDTSVEYSTGGFYPIARRVSPHATSPIYGQRGNPGLRLCF